MHSRVGRNPSDPRPERELGRCPAFTQVETELAAPHVRGRQPDFDFLECGDFPPHFKKNCRRHSADYIHRNAE